MGMGIEVFNMNYKIKKIYYYNNLYYIVINIIFCIIFRIYYKINRKYKMLLHF